MSKLPPQFATCNPHNCVHALILARAVAVSPNSALNRDARRMTRHRKNGAREMHTVCRLPLHFACNATNQVALFSRTLKLALLYGTQP